MKKALYLLSLMLFFSSCASTGNYQRNMRGSERGSRLEAAAQKWLNTPYLYGGTDKRGIDCSALARNIYREAYRYELPRTSNEQYKKGKMVRLSWIRAGDLIFFKRNRSGALDHVGVYLGGQRFIHATLHKGVIISKLNTAYYKERIVGIRRYPVGGRN